VTDLPAVAIAATTAGTTATAATSRFGMGFVHVKSSAIKVLTIESSNGAPCFGVVGHFDKAKAPGLTCLAVGNDIHALNGAVTGEERTDAFVRGPKTEVSYKDVFHSLFLLDLTGS
jgi:hypothetical protein